MAILATASAPEGEAVFGNWNAKGLAHYQQLGLKAAALPVRTREDAFEAVHADAVRASSLVFFSGGNPRFLEQTLRETPLLAAIRDALSAGTVFGGCSAGAMVAGASLEESGPPLRFPVGKGLGLLPEEVFGVHWDAHLMSPWRALFRSRVPASARFIGIAENTAILGGAEGWRVRGRGEVEVRFRGDNRSFRDGEFIPALAEIAQESD